MGYRTISINGNKIDTISIFDASKKIGQYDISKNNTQISGNGGQNAFDTKYLVPGTRYFVSSIEISKLSIRSQTLTSTFTWRALVPAYHFLGHPDG